MPGQLGVKIGRGQNKVLFFMPIFTSLHLDSLPHPKQNSPMSESFDGHAPESSKKKSRLTKKSLLSKLFVLGLVAALAAVAYLYLNAQKELARLSTAQGQTELAQREIKEVTEKLGKLTLLPDEEPVIATVMDAQLLATQSAFYQNAENGDKLVVYPKAQKAYIYSPAKNIIVNAGPLVVDQDQNSRPVRFELRNGSGTPGAAATLKDKLEQQQQLVSALTDAANSNYTQTLVIPINPAIQPDQLTTFAASLGVDARVAAELPTGEATSEADILIIVGSSASDSQAVPQSTPPSP